MYYEQRRYALALRYAEKAFAEFPSCPLVLWDYAGALQALGRHHEALDPMCESLRESPREGDVRRESMGERTLRRFPYLASISLKAIGQDEASLSAFEQCVDIRGGCRSIYRLDELHTWAV